ncbi:MAG: ATP-binding protein, partial [bacterium]
LGAWVWWSAALLALIGMTIVAAMLYHRLILHDARATERENLAAIADLKAGQVSRWRQERLSDVAAISADSAIARVAMRFCDNTNAADRAILLPWLGALRRHADCRSATLLDARFQPVLCSGDEEKKIGPWTERAARQAWIHREPSLSDLHRGADVQEIHLDLIAPLNVLEGATTTTVATLLLRIDPYRTLYPMLRRWPTPSPSGETLLVRRDGDLVLYLSELRSRPGMALGMGFPLTNTQYATVRAVSDPGSGRLLATALDERGERVMWAAKRVRECPWYVITRKNLREIDAPVHRETLLVNATVAGLVLALLAVIVALWRRDRYQAALAHMAVKQHLDLWLRFANDIILLMNEDGQVVEANERAVLSYGYPLTKLLRMNVRELLAAESDADWRRHDLIYETVHRRKDGQLFPVEVSARRIEVQGCAYHQQIVRDITEPRRLEAQLRQSQKFDAIGRLAGGVAHDFNNILTAIIGYSDLLLDGPIDDATARPQIEEIRKSSERAANLTRQLLAFSSRQPAQMQVLDLNRIVGEMEKLLCRVIGEHIHLETTLPPDLGCVQADHGQIEQVVMNLSINARDAMPGGGHIRIRTANITLGSDHLRLHPQAQEGEHVLLEVSDTGCGMTRDVLSHIFEPFYTTKAQGKGTGLGLATVYGIVRQSGGHITVDSEVPRGTTFRIYLPRYTGTTVPQAARTEAPAPAANGHETILVVEDEASVRKLACGCLRRAGYTVLEAADGEEALHVARQHGSARIDLLFTDMVMPEIDGQTLSARLRQHCPGLRVLYTTGYFREMPDKDAVDRGEVRLLPKPYTTTQLTSYVRALLDPAANRA